MKSASPSTESVSLPVAVSVPALVTAPPIRRLCPFRVRDAPDWMTRLPSNPGETYDLSSTGQFDGLPPTGVGIVMDGSSCSGTRPRSQFSAVFQSVLALPSQTMGAAPPEKTQLTFPPLSCESVAVMVESVGGVPAWELLTERNETSYCVANEGTRMFHCCAGLVDSSTSRLPAAPVSVSPAVTVCVLPASNRSVLPGVWQTRFSKVVSPWTVFDVAPANVTVPPPDRAAVATPLDQFPYTVSVSPEATLM